MYIKAKMSVTGYQQKKLTTVLIQCHFDYSCSSWFSDSIQNSKRQS